jgi:hypothetical protein
MKFKNTAVAALLIVTQFSISEIAIADPCSPETLHSIQNSASSSLSSFIAITETTSERNLLAQLDELRRSIETVQQSISQNPHCESLKSQSTTIDARLQELSRIISESGVTSTVIAFNALANNVNQLIYALRSAAPVPLPFGLFVSLIADNNQRYVLTYSESGYPENAEHRDFVAVYFAELYRNCSYAFQTGRCERRGTPLNIEEIDIHHLDPDSCRLSKNNSAGIEVSWAQSFSTAKKIAQTISTPRVAQQFHAHSHEQAQAECQEYLSEHAGSLSAAFECSILNGQYYFNCVNDGLVRGNISYTALEACVVDAN